jgi:hypothetical protein
MLSIDDQIDFLNLKIIKINDNLYINRFSHLYLSFEAVSNNGSFLGTIWMEPEPEFSYSAKMNKLNENQSVLSIIELFQSKEFLFLKDKLKDLEFYQ